ncbi:MAG: glycosyltransferase family 2 protein [Acidimicrobiales bacterium]
MTAGPRPDIAVAVSTYQRPDRLARLVEGLERQTLGSDRFEVVIVDNGSADDTFEVLEKLAAGTELDLRPLRREENRGPAAARNAAWGATSAPFVAFTDDDCVPDPEWLEAGLRTLRRHSAMGVVQGRTMIPVLTSPPPNTDWLVWRDIRQLTPWFEGCNLFFRREALEAVGGFDESIGWYGEETALGWGVLAAGWDRIYEDAAVIRHDVTQRPLRLHLRDRYLEGNMVGIAKRYPALRQEGFWRPWAMHRQNALFAVGVAGLALGLWRRPALLLAAPYLITRRPRWGHHRYLRLTGEHVLVDAAAFAGMLRASIRERTFVL